MKAFITLFICICVNSVFGQVGLTSYPADTPIDSLGSKLEDIRTSNNTFYFRLKISGQTIDIFSKDEEYHGTITNHIKQYDQVKTDDIYTTEATKLYAEKIHIDPMVAASLANTIIQSGQSSIPTDTLIDSWSRWFLHCENLDFEVKQNDNHVRQSFYCPWSQPDSVAYKDVILSNYNSINEDLNLDSVYQDFKSQLPKGKTYSRDGYRMLYIMTEKQYKAWEEGKPRREYLSSINNRLDAYLINKLAEQHIEFNDLSCFENYNLSFNKKGKLKKVQVSDYEKPKLLDGLAWYLEDKKEIRKCERLIKRTFRNIDLNSFDLRYNVYRSLIFDMDGSPMLMDNTVY